MGGVTSCTCHCRFRDSRMVVYSRRLVGRDVRAAGGVSIDTVQPVGGVTLRLRLRLIIVELQLTYSLGDYSQIIN